MRRLLIAAALVGATLVPGIAEAQEEPPLTECPAGTMAGDTFDDGRLYCVCVTESTIPIYERGTDGSAGWVGDPESCPDERAPEPPEDCADAPGCVLGVTVERDAPAAVPAAVVAPGVAPAFTG